MCHILIIGAHDVYRSLLRTALEQTFHNRVSIIEAGTGSEAVEKVSRSDPELVFLDITLPGTGGMDLLQDIKRFFPTARIVALIEYDIPEYKDAAYRHGADHVLVKTAFCLRKINMAVRSIPSCNERPSPGCQCNSPGPDRQHSTDCRPRLP